MSRYYDDKIAYSGALKYSGFPATVSSLSTGPTQSCVNLSQLCALYNNEKGTCPQNFI